MLPCRLALREPLLDLFKLLPQDLANVLQFLDSSRSAQVSAPHCVESKGNADLRVECPTSSLKCEKGSVRCPTAPSFGVRVEPGYVKKAMVVSVA